MPELSWGAISVPVGRLAMVADAVAVRRIYLCRGEADLGTVVREDFPTAVPYPGPLVFSTLQQLDEYFRGFRTGFELPLSSHGLSLFARRVQRALLTVSFGQTISYAGLAERVGFPRAARAVGKAMATNPFPIVVPCHRVIRSDGTPGEYSAADGTPTKQWLLDFEQNRPLPQS